MDGRRPRARTGHAGAVDQAAADPRQWRDVRRSRFPASSAIIVLSLAACQATTPAAGHLELRFRLPPDATAGLTEIRLTPAWGGANRGGDRNSGYARIPLAAPDVVLPASGGGAVVVARGEIPAGGYTHVFVETARVLGHRPDGTMVAVTSHIEPIARGFELPAGGRVAIEIELIVLPPVERFGSGIEVFVKNAVAVRP